MGVRGIGQPKRDAGPREWLIWLGGALVGMGFGIGCFVVIRVVVEGIGREIGGGPDYGGVIAGLSAAGAMVAGGLIALAYSRYADRFHG